MQNSKKCIIKHLRRPMTGWSAPVERTPFLMLTEKWTRLPIAPTCQIRTQMLTRIRKTVNVCNAPTAARWTLQSIDSKSATNGGIPPSILQSMHQHGFSNDKHAYKSIYAGSCVWPRYRPMHRHIHLCLCKWPIVKCYKENLLLPEKYPSNLLHRKHFLVEGVISMKKITKNLKSCHFGNMS